MDERRPSCSFPAATSSIEPIRADAFVSLELETGATLVWILQYSAALANALVAVPGILRDRQRIMIILANHRWQEEQFPDRRLNQHGGVIANDHFTIGLFKKLIYWYN